MLDRLHKGRHPVSKVPLNIPTRVLQRHQLLPVATCLPPGVQELPSISHSSHTGGPMPGFPAGIPFGDLLGQEPDPLQSMSSTWDAEEEAAIAMGLFEC